MIFFLAEGIEALKQNPKRIPEKLYKGHMMIMKFLFGNVEQVPNNLYDLFVFLNHPFREWNISILDELFPLEESFLEEDLSLSEVVVEFLNEYQSPEESDLLPIKDFLIYSRENDLDSIYRDTRTFLSKVEHAVMKQEDLFSYFYTEFKEDFVKDLILKCYEPIKHPIDHYRICAHCGWTLENRKGEWVCNSHSVCNKLGDFNAMQKFDSSFRKSVIIRLKPAIQRFVLIPGMQELRIAGKLKKYNPIMYPNIDEFDLRIEVNGSAMNIDIKDIKNPVFLAKLFNQMDKKQLAKYQKNDCYVVIPDYRISWYKGYQKILKANLDTTTSTLLDGKFISERELGKLINGRKSNGS